MYVTERFKLSNETKSMLKSMKPAFGFNGYGEAIFYRTYSREIFARDATGKVRKDARGKEIVIGQEHWPDVVTRSTEGTFSIRKDWYKKNRIPWDEEYWQNYAVEFAISMFKMHWMPPGRGLWAMGTDFVYERGSMCLYNCAYTDITDDFDDDVGWLMDSLMVGCGVGFGPHRNDKMELYVPHGSYDFIIPDSREGWVESVVRLLQSYKYPGRQRPRFIYDLVRKEGEPIKGFGGRASGPGPLKDLHEGIIESCERFRENRAYDSVRFKVDLANKTGCCVVAGNVRRSAELACASIRDKTFLELKNYELHPDRESYGWMSNNSVILESDEDFNMLGEIAKRVIVRGEPGYINKRNMKYGRIGKRDKLRPDRAVGFNPCGEIPLEHREVCNVAETLPTMCDTPGEWFNACRHVTFYMSTVSLLPTHQPSTNKVVARNRRIGASIVDVIGWKQAHGVHQVTSWMRKGYKIVRETNRSLNKEAKVPESIRVTTIKPGGTTPKLPGRRSGIGHANFEYMIRRTRVQEGGPIDVILRDSGIPHEPDVFSKLTTVYEFPVHVPGKPAGEVSLWEQAMTLVWVQREWSDNAVSNTLNYRPKWAKIDIIKDDFVHELSFYTDSVVSSIGLAKDLVREGRDWYETDDYRISFKYSKCGHLREIHVYRYDPRHEEDDIEPVLSAIAPLTKSVTLMPHSDKGAYPQMPEEGITKLEYLRRLSEITEIDWSKFGGSDGIDERYCDGERCEIPTH